MKINFQLLLHSFDQDITLAKEAFLIFQEKIPIELEHLVSAITRQDFAEATKVNHKIKGMISNFDAALGEQATRAIHEELHNQTNKDFDPLLLDLRSSLDDFESSLQKFFCQQSSS